MDKINFMELRWLVREYGYEHGEFPLISEIYKIYKAKFNYTKDVRNFGKELHSLQAEGHLIGFIPVETTYTHIIKTGKRKGEVTTKKKKVQRIIVR